jgi:hypothetical protein
LTKQNTNIIVLIVILLTGVVAVSFGLFTKTNSSKRVFSEDGAYYVQIAEENGGATTSFYSVVRITDADSVFSNLGVLSAWTGNRASIFALKGQLASVKTTWVNNRTLSITYTDCRQVYGKDNAWRDIKIVYEEQCSKN